MTTEPINDNNASHDDHLLAAGWEQDPKFSLLTWSRGNIVLRYTEAEVNWWVGCAHDSGAGATFSEAWGASPSDALLNLAQILEAPLRGPDPECAEAAQIARYSAQFPRNTRSTSTGSRKLSPSS